MKHHDMKNYPTHYKLKPQVSLEVDMSEVMAGIFASIIFGGIIMVFIAQWS